MNGNPKKLLWLDLETTGLDPQSCSIVEVAAILTNDNLDIHKEISYVVRPINDNGWSIWAVEQHRQNGLIHEISERGLSLADVKSSLMAMLRMWAKPREVVLAGRSVHFDRSFLKSHMPELESFLHHRHLDVSSISIFTEHLGLHQEQPKDGKHRALSDIKSAMHQYMAYCAAYRELRGDAWEPGSSIINAPTTQTSRRIA
jgi:oligoribonuclease